MKMTKTFDNFNRAFSLEPIIVSLTLREEVPDWSIEKIKMMEQWYRRYLYLIHLYPDKIIVPTKEIDIFWHHHILDTLKYMEDCQALFGRYIHHFPYFGMRGEDDRKNLKNAFSETTELFEKHFGESPITFNSVDCGALCAEPGPDPKPYTWVIKPNLRPTLATTNQIH